jgi:pimeloyl-ACP methyl ester carboxylesterase
MAPETREPVVLLHGLTMSGRVWHRVRPLLAADFEVITPTALGHSGGRPAAPGRATLIADVVDDAERTLDELGLDTAHLAGNSMGGWVALELARRGRARSVCALSPAGTWDAASREHQRTRAVLGRARIDTQRSRALLPLALRLPAIRRYALRSTAADGARVARADILAAADDVLDCAVAQDLLDTTEALAPLDPVPCPITIAWAAGDRLLLPEVNGALARELVPGAEHVSLPGVGHVPMLDDPRLVAATIREVIAAASARTSGTSASA